MRRRSLDLSDPLRTACRVFVVTKFEEAIYVLHAFEKKSGKTAKSDVDLARRRYRDLIAERDKR